MKYFIQIYYFQHCETPIIENEEVFDTGIRKEASPF